MYQLFFSDILFLLKKVYSFRQNEDDTKIAAAFSRGLASQLPRTLALSPPLPSLMYRITHPLLHDRDSIRCPGIKINAR